MNFAGIVRTVSGMRLDFAREAVFSALHVSEMPRLVTVFS